MILFHDHLDYTYFTKRIFYFAHECHIRLITYCLMPNHYHLLVQEPKSNESPLGCQIASFCLRLQTSYAKYYMKKHTGHSGHVFQGPYVNKKIKDSDYFWDILEYIHYNPVRKKIVYRPKDWRYSGYNLLF